MKQRSKEKSYTNVFDARLNLCRWSIYIKANVFKKICTAAYARHRTVTMFGHVSTCSRCHYGCCRADVKCSYRVASRATSIDKRLPYLRSYPSRMVSHRIKNGSKLVSCLSFHSKGHKKGCDRCIWNHPSKYCVKCLGNFNG